MDIIDLTTLLLVQVTLMVAVIALPKALKTASVAEKIASLTEERITALREEQERVQSFYQEKHKSLEGELERERQERLEAQKDLEQERQQRLEALQKAESAEQEAMREATLQLRKWMEHYLVELDEDGQRDDRRAN
jgi:biopolymer transport protein ExbB/TolQ